MQALWSRAAQARSSCRCSSCLHAASAIARRTTTATSKRRIKFGDLFTACYSTIFATAVFADARVKEDRRKEWDRIIAEAKAGLPVDETAVPKSTYGERKAEKMAGDLPGYFPGTRYYQADPIQRRAWSDSNFELLHPKEAYVPQGHHLRGLDNQLKTLVGSSDQYAPVPDTSSTSSPGEDWFDVDDFEALPSQSFSPREPFNRKHLDRMGETVRNLVDQLLLKTDILSVRQPTSNLTKSDFEAQTVEIVQRIEKLRTSFVRLPAYSWESDPALLQEQRTALHKSLVSLCAKASPDPDGKPDRSRVDLLIAKICYNLLISTNPPNIGTYNILIRELTRLEQHEFAQSVVDSFLHDCRMRPNERTIKLILDHYYSKHDPTGLRDTINRMRASDGHMWVEFKTVYQLCDPAVRLWAISNRIMHRGAWLFQKVDRTPAVFESLFRSSFDLVGTRAATRFIVAALREGQTVPTDVFCRVVRGCLDEWDYKAARQLLKAILSAWHIGFTSIIELSPDFRRAFHRLLALSNVKPASDVYPLFPSLIHIKYQDALRDMLRWSRIQSIEDSLNRVQQLVASAEVGLDISLPPTSGPGEAPMSHDTLRDEGVSKTLEVLERFSRLEHSLKAERLEWPAEVSYIKFEALRVELNDFSISTANIGQEIKSFRARQSRRKALSQVIKGVEAEIAAQKKWVTIQEYEMLSFLSAGLPVWAWNTLTSAFWDVRAQGLLLRRPLEYAMKLSKRAEKEQLFASDAVLLEQKGSTFHNQLDGVEVQHTNEHSDGNVGYDVGTAKNASNNSESHEVGHESAKPDVTRFPPRSPAEPYPPQFNIPSPPAVVLRQPDSPLLLSSPRSYDTFKCIEGWAGDDAFT